LPTTDTHDRRLQSSGEASAARAGSAIEGVKLISLRMHRDDRGHVTELFGADWPELAGFSPAQWHILVSRAGTLRGMHVHVRHDDLKIVAGGEVVLALKDLRRGSPSEGRVQLLTLSGSRYVAVLIPAGVAHGILAQTDSLVVVGVTRLYDGGDELECAWDDSGLGINWPGEPAILSERDSSAQSLAALVGALEPWQPLWPGASGELASGCR
jgi:dTDP-4-dehydrorhamnose 3,5-epimerase